MAKQYSEYMDEITPERLYEGLLGYGMFTKKLPSIFSSREFYNYVRNNNSQFCRKEHGYVFYESIRNTNIPRELGIPHPIAYQLLCDCIKNNWFNLREYFHSMTDEWRYKVSRIHIRLKSRTKCLFKMNYHQWKLDPDPIPDILIGKRYVVKADISTCFPSIYSHSLSWALIGKDKSKESRNDKRLWTNQIDFFTRNIRSGETHGLMIGPHASNLLSEIVLTAVDSMLVKRWDYIRNIDDYTCYVKTYDEANSFLSDLRKALHEYDLLLNHRKTVIDELPVSITKHWVRQLNSFGFRFVDSELSYKQVQAYLDSVVGLMDDNNSDSAILNYAIKVLAKFRMSHNAMEYASKTILHLSFIYPYLVPLLNNHVFTSFKSDVNDISSFSNLLYNASLSEENYEAVIYSLFFAIMYRFRIADLAVDDVIDSNSCLFKLFAWVYYRIINDRQALHCLHDHALSLCNYGFDDNYWLFIYEVLESSQLQDEWKCLKNHGVSFIKNKYL